MAFFRPVGFGETFADFLVAVFLTAAFADFSASVSVSGSVTGSVTVSATGMTGGLALGLRVAEYNLPKKSSVALSS